VKEIFHTPPLFSTSVKGDPRSNGLSGGEKISKIFLFALTRSTNVTDGRTDGQTPHDGIGHASA